MLGLVIFFSPWTESYDYQSKDSNDDFKIDFTCFSLVWSVFEYPKKTLEKPELSKQHIESRLPSVIIDGKLEKKWANGQICSINAEAVVQRCSVRVDSCDCEMNNWFL